MSTLSDRQFGPRCPRAGALLGSLHGEMLSECAEYAASYSACWSTMGGQGMWFGRMFEVANAAALQDERTRAQLVCCNMAVVCGVFFADWLRAMAGG
jgi:hypothetical protein